LEIQGTYLKGLSQIVLKFLFNEQAVLVSASEFIAYQILKYRTDLKPESGRTGYLSILILFQQYFFGNF